MKERKKITYYPRSHFWKFWEKRQIEMIKTVSDEKKVYTRFLRNGTMSGQSIRWNNGDEEDVSYHENGQKYVRSLLNSEGTRWTQWDENGKVVHDEGFDKKTDTQTYYHPNGTVYIRHNRTTGSVEMFTADGKLKRKGRWVNRDGSLASTLNTCGSEFETGNMRQKLRDATRQEYNKAIDAINKLPETRVCYFEDESLEKVKNAKKVAKEALAKAYKEDLQAREKAKKTLESLTRGRVLRD